MFTKYDMKILEIVVALVLNEQIIYIYIYMWLMNNDLYISNMTE